MMSSLLASVLRLKLGRLISSAALACMAAASVRADRGPWIDSWCSAQQVTEPRNLPPSPGLAHRTLREVAHLTLGGPAVRVRVSNEFGDAPLALDAAAVAAALKEGAIEPGTSHPLTFQKAAGVTVPAGAYVDSDPIEMAVAPGSDLAVTLAVSAVPLQVTGHPGSRATSFIATGAAVSAATLPGAEHVDHWYLLSAVAVPATARSSAIVVLGDSITDGRGSTTNGNDRWPDQLFRRLQADPATRDIAVLNTGIGGNRLLHDGLGPNALSRLDRDVLDRKNVRWLIVFEGVNDIGSAGGAHGHGDKGPTAADIIGAYRQIVTRAHACDLRVIGATITPFGESFYFTPEREAERQAVNDWIRSPGNFDAVIDFDRITRDPAKPSHLAAAVDGGDHLHPSAAGYRIMAESIDPALFAPPVPGGRSAEPEASHRSSVR